MNTFREFLESFMELSEHEKLHISSYKEYLESHSDDSKTEYVSNIFVPDKVLGQKKITTMSHDRFSNPNYHSHRFMEINYILEGDFINNIEGQEILMHKGDICILPPLIFHSMDIIQRDVLTRSNSYAIHLFINSNAIKEFFSDTENESFAKFITGIVNGENHRKFAFFRCCDTGVNEWIAKFLFYSTHQSYKASLNDERSPIYHLTRAFIAEMLNPAHYDLSFSTSFTGNSSTNDIIGYISKNFRSVTLEQVAQHFNYSFSYASKLIKKLTGMGFSKLLSGIRFDKAASLLTSTEMTVQDIAAECGFCTIEHFHRSFRSRFGMTPTEYREAHK